MKKPPAKEAKSNEPKPVRLIGSDVTIEFVGELLAANQDREVPRCGLLMFVAEFAGLIGRMDKYGGGGGKSGFSADRAFWLQAFDGGSYTVDRISRGSLHIPEMALSMLGGIQPDLLGDLDKFTSDGMLQRFMPCMMTDAVRPRDECCAAETQAYEHLVLALLAVQPRQFTLDDLALQRMRELEEYLYDIEKATSGGFRQFVGKLHGLAGSLALVLHLAANPANAPARIGREVIANVDRLVREFILPHAMEFYAVVEGATGKGELTRKIASWILTSGKDKIGTRDLVMNVADLREATVTKINDAVGPLVAADWLEPADPKLGPRNKAWKVNSRVHREFAERARTEAERKAKLGELMGARRKAGS